MSLVNDGVVDPGLAICPGKKLLSREPKHFIRISVTYCNSIENLRHWLYTETTGRWFLNNESYDTVVGFEEPADATLFGLVKDQFENVSPDEYHLTTFSIKTFKVVADKRSLSADWTFELK